MINDNPHPCAQGDFEHYEDIFLAVYGAPNSHDYAKWACAAHIQCVKTLRKWAKKLDAKEEALADGHVYRAERIECDAQSLKRDAMALYAIAGKNREFAVAAAKFEENWVGFDVYKAAPPIR